MNRLLLIPLVCLIVAVPSGKASAIHKCGSRCVKCPSCNQGCCSLDVSEGKVKKTYWTIEREQICVPNFLFPWQCPKKNLLECGCGKKGCGGCADGGCSTSSGCHGACGDAGCTGGCRYATPGHKGGRVKTIRVLKKHSYECPVCLYKWSAKGSDGGCSKRCSSNCACHSGSRDSDSSQEPTHADSSEPPASEAAAPDQPAPLEPLQKEPAIEESVPSDSTSTGKYSDIAPQSYDRPDVAPVLSHSVVDPFTLRVFGRSKSVSDR